MYYNMGKQWKNMYEKQPINHGRRGVHQIVITRLIACFEKNRSHRRPPARVYSHGLQLWTVQDKHEWGGGGG